MFDLIYLWVDLIWLPIAYFITHKNHRWWSLGFIVASMVLVRLLSELMTFIGYSNGIMGFMSSNVHTRGLVVSSIFYVLFFIMAYFSSSTKGVVFMAACLTIFFAIFVTSSLIMVL